MKDLIVSVGFFYEGLTFPTVDLKVIVCYILTCSLFLSFLLYIHFIRHNISNMIENDDGSMVFPIFSKFICGFSFSVPEQNAYQLKIS